MRKLDETNDRRLVLERQHHARAANRVVQNAAQFAFEMKPYLARIRIDAEVTQPLVALRQKCLQHALQPLDIVVEMQREAFDGRGKLAGRRHETDGISRGLAIKRCSIFRNRWHRAE